MSRCVDVRHLIPCNNFLAIGAKECAESRLGVRPIRNHASEECGLRARLVWRFTVALLSHLLSGMQCLFH